MDRSCFNKKFLIWCTTYHFDGWENAFCVCHVQGSNNNEKPAYYRMKKFGIELDLRNNAAPDGISRSQKTLKEVLVSLAFLKHCGRILTKSLNSTVLCVVSVPHTLNVVESPNSMLEWGFSLCVHAKYFAFTWTTYQKVQFPICPTFMTCKFDANVKNHQRSSTVEASWCCWILYTNWAFSSLDLNSLSLHGLIERSVEH